MCDALAIIGLQFFEVTRRHSDDGDEGAHGTIIQIAFDCGIEDQNVDEAIVKPLPTRDVLEQQHEALSSFRERLTYLPKKCLQPLGGDAEHILDGIVAPQVERLDKLKRRLELR